MLLDAALSLSSPAGPRGRLSILIFHRVLPSFDAARPLIPDVARFDRALSHLGRYFNVLPLAQAVDALQSGCLPARAAAITFDDGYADNYLHALPVLQKHGLHATFFVATGFLDGGIMWNDALGVTVRGTAKQTLDCAAAGLGALPLTTPQQRGAALRTLIAAVKHMPYEVRAQAVSAIARQGDVQLPTDLMMTTAQLQALHRSGMEIGAHTVTHPILSRCEPGFACEEIAKGRRTLQEKIDAPVRLFAYPNGKPGVDYLPEHVACVREQGFLAAVSTATGAARQGDSVYELPRFTPWDEGQFAFGARMLQNLLQAWRASTVTAEQVGSR